MISQVLYGNDTPKKYEITIVILTYEQEREKVLLTVASSIKQEEVNLQIIISDDGSTNPCLQDCIEYMEREGFKDYKVIYHKENVGTVNNFIDAVKMSDGDYIKSFGPGDCFSMAKAAYLWLKHIRKEEAQLSFCDSIYYRYDEKGYECVIEVAHPQEVRIYDKKSTLQKKYYLLYNDIFLGAAIVGQKEVIYQYLQRIQNKIKFAEDNMIRLMLLEGVKCSYFACNAIYYEWGDGISTSEDSKYRNVLKQEWDWMTKYVCECCKNNIIENMIKNYYFPDEKKSAIKSRIYNFLAKIDIYLYGKRCKGKKRLSSEDDLCYLDNLRNSI